MFHLRRHHDLLSPQHTQGLNTNSRGRGFTSTARDANTHNTEINNRGTLWTLHAGWVQLGESTHLLLSIQHPQQRLPSARRAGSRSPWLPRSLRTVPSLLLQQCRDVDVPANGLPVKATGEQVAHGMVLTPGRAAHHPPVALRPSTQHSQSRAPQAGPDEPHTPKRPNGNESHEHN